MWKRNRTSMIPKEGKDASRAENWRSLTIASILTRLFSTCIKARIKRKTSLSTRQRGFVQGNGCYINTLLLDEAIRRGKRRELCVAQLDISKAFDTVHHTAIWEALLRSNAPRAITNIILDMYRDASTIIAGTSAPIFIRREVKQGDFLSPFLFNLVTDPMTTALKQTQGFHIMTVQNLSVLAFADDIIQLVNNPERLQFLLNLTSYHVDAIDLKISAPKSVAFHFRHTNKTWITEPLQARL